MAIPNFTPSPSLPARPSRTAVAQLAKRWLESKRDPQLRDELLTVLVAYVLTETGE